MPGPVADHLRLSQSNDAGRHGTATPPPSAHLGPAERRTYPHRRDALQAVERAHPERGGAQKDPAFWHKGAIKAHRMLLSDVVNVHLEYAGLAARVHPGLTSWTEDAQLQQPHARSPSCCPARAAPTASRGHQSPHAGGARHPAGTGGTRRRRTGTGAGAALLGRHERATRHHGNAAHGAQDLCDHARRGRSAESMPLDGPWWTWTSVWTNTAAWQPRSRRIYHTPEQEVMATLPQRIRSAFAPNGRPRRPGYRRAANDHYGPGTGVARTATGRRSRLAGEFQRLMRLLDPEDGTRARRPQRAAA